MSEKRWDQINRLQGEKAALKAENARLRKALEECITQFDYLEGKGFGTGSSNSVRARAIEALSGKSDPNLASSHTLACNVRFQKDEGNLRIGKCTCSGKSE